MKVIIKKPGEPVGHMDEIDDDLEVLWGIVGGYIETLTVGNIVPVTIICNEEGKLDGLPANFWIRTATATDLIVGTAIIARVEGDEFGDVPLGLAEWESLLHSWGN